MLFYQRAPKINNLSEMTYIQHLAECPVMMVFLKHKSISYSYFMLLSSSPRDPKYITKTSSKNAGTNFSERHSPTTANLLASTKFTRSLYSYLP